jgi:hypothetical protein
VARTKTPAPAPPVTTPEAPQDPPTQDVARPSPVLAWPAEWPVPELPAEKPRRTRGLPMAPVLTGAGNGTTLLATAAYSAGGPAAAAAAGAVVAAGAAAAVLRRRAAVRRGVASRAGGGTTVGPLRGGGGSGLRGGSSGGVKRAGGGSWRGVSGGRSGAGSGVRSGLSRSGGASNGGPSRGSLSTGRHSGSGGAGSRLGGGLGPKKGGRHAAPNPGSGPRSSATGRQQKGAGGATDKAVKKALKRAAKDLAAKSGKTSPAATLKAAAGRTARAAWTASRSHRDRARQTAARAARHTAGALTDGLRATGAGVWAWLRHRDPKAALDRLKTVWRRLRKNRTASDSDATPAVADTIRRPTLTTPATTTGGPMSGGHHFVAAATEMARAAAAYQPTGMLQVGQDFTGLEEALRIHAEALKTTVENADANWPLHPNIVELMRQIHGLQLKAAELAAELKPAFNQLHDVDIARLENPRTGERMWDVSSNL